MSMDAMAKSSFGNLNSLAMEVPAHRRNAARGRNARVMVLNDASAGVFFICGAGSAGSDGRRRVVFMPKTIGRETTRQIRPLTRGVGRSRQNKSGKNLRIFSHA